MEKADLSKRLGRPAIWFSWSVLLLFLGLILKSGLYSDDLQDFQVMHSHGPYTIADFYDKLCSDFKLSTDMGRYTPVTFLMDELIMYVSASILMYKIIVFLMNILAVWVFSGFIKRIGLGHYLPLTIISCCAVFQFYINYHDAFTSLHAMYPFLALLIFAGLNQFWDYLHTGRIVKLLMCLIISAFAILNCEVGFVVFPLYAILLLFDQSKLFKKWLVFGPFTALVIIYLVILYKVRVNSEFIYEGVSVSPEIWKIGTAMFIQMAASLPLIGLFRIAAIPEVFSKQTLHVWPVLLLFTGLFYLTYLAWNTERQKWAATSKNHLLPVTIGFCLWLLPAFLIASTARYQKDLRLGFGYLPVLIQDFGVLILLTVFYDVVYSSNRIAGTWKRLILPVFFVLGLIAYIRNSMLIDTMNAGRSMPACVFYKNLKNGLLNDCQANSLIILRNDFFWRAPYLYETITGNMYHKHFRMVDEQFFSWTGTDSAGPVYLLDHDSHLQSTHLYQIRPSSLKLLKTVSYPAGKDFSYFDLISKPL